MVTFIISKFSSIGALEMQMSFGLWKLWFFISFVTSLDKSADESKYPDQIKSVGQIKSVD